MGFVKTQENVDSWYSHFRQRQDGGQLDVIFLQDTHVVQGESRQMSDQYLRAWGFNNDSEHRRLSLWTESESRTAGLAILLNPYSSVETLTPWKEELWTAHWMAVEVLVHGSRLLLINGYAPSNRNAREIYFTALADFELEHAGPVLFGGDFNCTLCPATDRSYKVPDATHDSKGLRNLLDRWDLLDALEEEIDRATEERTVMEFQRRHHTYHYTVPEGIPASSRLDRWYISSSHDDWVRTVKQQIPGPRSDHNGVSIRIAPPDKLIRIRRPRTVYPTPRYAAKQTEETMKAFFDAAQTRTLEHVRDTEESEALQLASWWDQSKTDLRRRLIELVKNVKATMENGYRQRLQRLHACLDAAIREQLPQQSSDSKPTAEHRHHSAADSVLDIRKSIARCRAAWQAKKKEKLFRSHTFAVDRTSKAFYARISTKFLDNTIYTLGGKARHGPKRSQELADDMADGWMATMQQPDADESVVADFLAGLGTPGCELLDGGLCQPITEEEILVAIKTCKRGKATGPDELGNDWYRDHGPELAPILARLFNCWFQAGVVPESFGEAIVQCIKKGKSAAVPLDHRPIALLNSDYKIYTRVFATRLRPMLPPMIDPAQAGFVPGRSIETVIDTFSAAQSAAKTDERMRRAIALLLDFMKAYDSLLRRFLLMMLAWLGFPPQFVRMVASLHSNTSCRFRVNGFLSRTMAVTCGIRQGCPVAPLLFILALEALYRAIRATPDISGVRLGTTDHETEVRISGYADDTAIYLNDSTQIPAVLRILDAFGEASGLRVNLKKSVSVPLSQSAVVNSPDLHGMVLLQRGDFCRYLGIQVGQTDSVQDNWAKCIRSLKARLALARVKTHSVEQRAQIARAIIVPKVLYVARHSWPTAVLVVKLHKLVKEFVWGTRDGKTRRAWISEQQGELSVSKGGMAIPHIKTELVTMSAKAVGKWATAATDLERLLGDVLQGRQRLKPIFLTPKKRSGGQPELRKTLWQTGTEVVQAAAAPDFGSADTAGLLRRAGVMRQAACASQWNRGSYTVNCERAMNDEMRRELGTTRRQHGPFNAEWLKRASTTEDGWLLDSKGTTYKLAGSSVAAKTGTLDEIVSWEWERHGVVTFLPVKDYTHMPAQQRRIFERLCMALAYNYPQLLCRPPQPHVLRPYSQEPQQHHDWLLSSRASTLTHFDAGTARTVHRVTTMEHCDHAATQDYNGKRVTFEASPRFTRLVQIWASDERWIVRRRRLRRFVQRERTSIGITKRNQSQEAPEQQEIQDGLLLIGWKELRRIPSTGAYVAQTLYRLKSNKFPLWNRSAGNLSCPHPSCTAVAVSTSQHVFWECPGAKGWWSQLLKIWRRIGFDPGEAPLVWIFGLELPDIPSSTWPLLLQRMGDGMESEEIQEHIYPAAAVIWRFLAATAMHGIWSERLRRMEADGTQEGIHNVIVQTTLNRALQRLLTDGTCGRPGPHDDAALAVLRAYVTILRDETTVPDFRPCGEPQQDGTQFLLFFDGGSRGNPGPGGAGAVIVRLRQHHHAASVVWAASMAYGNKATTNNVAEYRGLLLGLRYAYNHALGPLHVVGDSAMVISQQRLHKSPAKAALASLYRATKALADVLGIQSWSHHYRDYNKMADCAANVAMDSQKSQQVAVPTTRPLIEQIEHHMDSDVGHWVAQTQDQFQQQDPNTRRPRSSPKEHAIAMRGLRRRLGNVMPSATHPPSTSGLAK